MSVVRPPVNVLYCESNVDGTIGGSHYCMLYLIESLDRAAYRPVSTFYEEHALVPRFKAAGETLIIPQIAMSTAGFAPLRKLINLFKFVAQIFRFRSFLRERRIALVHQNNSITRHHDWMLACLLAGVPYIAHERGINARYPWLDRWLSRRAALVIPMSKAIMNQMVSRGVPGDNIRVLYDGLDPAKVKPARTPQALREAYGLRPDQPVIGIVGNVREWKGQETVVRALIEVVKSHPEVVCFFVGSVSPRDTEYKERLDRLISEAGIDKNVRFAGYQSDPASFVNMMSIVMHASIQPEPFGMVVLEAMAQRKPIIGSRAGGVVEMVVDGQTGYTFPPGDAAMLAKLLSELLADPEKAARMGEAGYARLVESFTMDAYMEGIHGVYKAILSGRDIPDQIGIRPGV